MKEEQKLLKKEHYKNRKNTKNLYINHTENFIFNNSKHYLDTILRKSEKYLQKEFGKKRYVRFLQLIKPLYDIFNTKEIVFEFERLYYAFVKELYQDKDKYDKTLEEFFQNKKSKKIIWADCLEALKQMKSESISCMVTSPPYYNARTYAQWKNLNEYLNDMEVILRECYRVLDNHRVFVFNVGDIFDNDKLFTSSIWGKRRLPLGAYFINLFEKVGFSFVDDIIWDKGQVQSQRHKNGDKPYPYHQYPMNCYEHILVFHKHRLDCVRYP